MYRVEVLATVIITLFVTDMLYNSWLLILILYEADRVDQIAFVLGLVLV